MNIAKNVFSNTNPVNVATFFPLPAAMVGKGEGSSLQQNGFHTANLSVVTLCPDLNFEF